MKIFQGLYSRISRSERCVFFFWLKFVFFPLQGAFFCSFRPYFSIPQKQLFSVSALFLSPPKRQYIIYKIPSRRREINNKRGSIDNTYIKRKLHINKNKTTHKTRRKQHVKREKTTHKTQKNVGDNSKNLQRFSEKVQRSSRNLPRFLRKVQRFS